MSLLVYSANLTPNVQGLLETLDHFGRASCGCFGPASSSADRDRDAAPEAVENCVRKHAPTREPAPCFRTSEIGAPLSLAARKCRRQSALAHQPARWRQPPARRSCHLRPCLGNRRRWSET